VTRQARHDDRDLTKGGRVNIAPRHRPFLFRPKRGKETPPPPTLKTHPPKGKKKKKVCCEQVGGSLAFSRTPDGGKGKEGE